MPMPVIRPGHLVNNGPNGWWGFDPGFGLDEWKESVALYGTSELAVGRKTSSATLSGYVPFDRVMGCISFMLGYSWVDDAPGFPVIRRNLPAVHPLMPELMCDQLVECRGVKFDVKAAGHHPRSLAYAKYRMALLTFSFRQEKFPLLEDGDLDMSSLENYRGQEMRRFCHWVPSPRVEWLEVPGGFAAFDCPGKQWHNTNFIAPRLLFPQTKSQRKLIFNQVPESFLFDPYGFSKLDRYVGRINKFPFFANPNSAPGTDGGPSTWLFENWEVLDGDIYADPVASMAFQGLERRLNVAMYFTHFNPKLGAPDNPAAGWRVSLAQDGSYYPIKYRVETTPGVSVPMNLPRDFDFGRLFTRWDDVELE